mgnify:CR=1 FL=1
MGDESVQGSRIQLAKHRGQVKPSQVKHPALLPANMHEFGLYDVMTHSSAHAVTRSSSPTRSNHRADARADARAASGLHVTADRAELAAVGSSPRPTSPRSATASRSTSPRPSFSRHASPHGSTHGSAPSSLPSSLRPAPSPRPASPLSAASPLPALSPRRSTSPTPPIWPPMHLHQLKRVSPLVLKSYNLPGAQLYCWLAVRSSASPSVCSCHVHVTQPVLTVISLQPFACIQNTK